MTEDTATMGHNLPDADADPLKDKLYENYASQISRKDELLAGIARAPTVIEEGDEETAGKMADFVGKQINDFLKTAKAIHVDEKAPFLASGRTCDNFMHFLIDDLEKGKAKINIVRKAYADKKAAAERVRREEEERRAREEAREAQRKADAEAAERAREVAEAKRIADEAAEAERAEAAEVQRVADEAAQKMQDDEDMAAAEVAQAAADKIKRENAAREKARQEEADRIDAENAAKQKLVDEEAARAEKVAINAAKAADAKPAELGKSRGEYGGQSSLKEFYTYRDLDREALDLEKLRAHIPEDALDKAIKSLIKAGGRELRGCVIYQDTRL